MRSILRTTAAVTALAAGALLLAPGAAQAAPAPSCHYVHQSNGDNYGLLNGTQIYAPIDLGLDLLSGNALGILGSATAVSADDNSIVCGNGRHHRHHHHHRF